jgi:hypothetical protein
MGKNTWQSQIGLKFCNCRLRTFIPLASWLFLIIAIVTVVSPCVAAGKLSETDKKEIARILFDRSFPKSDNSLKQPVLLDPNTNLSLIPNIEGLDFRKLKYEEQSLVDEYFRLDLNERKGKVEAALLRGNRCLLSGERYRFKRKVNDWQPELVGYTQSRPTQQPCPGCKLFVDPSKHTYLRDQVPKRNTQQSLIISGEVEHLECVPEKEVFQCNAQVLLHFTNQFKGHNCFTEGGCSRQYAGFMLQQAFEGLSLLVSQLPFELDIDGSAAIGFVDIFMMDSNPFKFIG